jgi:hypothetical protein
MFPAANGLGPPTILFAWGVLAIIISSRSPIIGSSSSSLLLVSDSIMFTLDTELEIAVRSAGPDVEKGPIEVDPGEPRRCGMVTPRPPTVGDESGDDSAMIEWCRFVHAREKSSPRDRRGSTEPGEP